MFEVLKLTTTSWRERDHHAARNNWTREIRATQLVCILTEHEKPQLQQAKRSRPQRRRDDHIQHKDERNNCYRDTLWTLSHVVTTVTPGRQELCFFVYLQVFFLPAMKSKMHWNCKFMAFRALFQLALWIVSDCVWTPINIFIDNIRIYLFVCTWICLDAVWFFQTMFHFKTSCLMHDLCVLASSSMATHCTFHMATNLYANFVTENNRLNSMKSQLTRFVSCLFCLSICLHHRKK